MRLFILDADSLVATLADAVRGHLPDAEVETASSFQAGLKKLNERAYDTIITDARLPDAPGVAALSTLRQRYPDTPIILMASQFNRDLLAHATLNEIHHFVHKPVESNVLVAVLNRIIEQRRSETQIQQLTVKANRHTRRARKAIAFARLLLEAKERLLSRRQDSLEKSEESRRRVTATIDRLPYGILAVDPLWRMVWLNESVPPVFRAKSRDEWFGKCIWEECADLAGSYFEQECRRAVRDHVAVRFETGFPSEDQRYDVEAVPYDEGLSIIIRTVISTTHPLGNMVSEPPHASRSNHTSAESTFNGDTASPEVSDSRLAERIRTAREAERVRIARDLQDDLGQLLGALKEDLAWLDSRMSQEQLPALLKVRFMTHLVTRMTDSVRRICSELRPAILEDLGLAAAIQWQASTFEHRTGLRCLVSIKDVERVGREQSIGLYRIFQELLSNAARHARATVVWVTLKREADSLILELSDNGRGGTDGDMDPASPELLSLKERVALLRAELCIRGTPGQGTHISLKVPAADQHTGLS